MDVERIVDSVVARFIGTKHERDIKVIQPVVSEINALEPAMQKLTDAELAAYTPKLKAEVQARLEGVEDNDPDVKQKLKEAVEPAIVPAFAVVREAGRRTLGMRHFDVQLIGGIVLHQGKIAEMKTGEGKTLVATLPAYLNALAGRGVHIVTVNDYLARRDAEWMGPIYKMLGMTVGVIVHDLDDVQRRAAYGADITYGTNNEFGFDYLRDNMKYDLKDCVQRGHHFAIVDEVDSILIDEARTPLIISGPAEESTDKYYKIDKMIPKLIQEIDYTLDEKHKTATLTEEGVSKAEKLLGLGNLYDPAQHGDHSSRLPGTAGAHALPARRGLRGERRRSDHRRRIHRAADAGAALVGRPAPGGRSEGEGEDRAGEPDAGDDHFSELFPHVQEAVGHDRNGGNRSGGIRQDLQAGRGGDSDKSDADPDRASGRGVPDGSGEVRSGGERNSAGGRHEGGRDPAYYEAGSRCWWGASRSRSRKRSTSC